MAVVGRWPYEYAYGRTIAMHHVRKQRVLQLSEYKGQTALVVAAEGLLPRVRPAMEDDEIAALGNLNAKLWRPQTLQR
jgi:hypothetical protein